MKVELGTVKGSETWPWKCCKADVCVCAGRHERTLVTKSFGLSDQRQTRKHRDTEEVERQALPC